VRPLRAPGSASEAQPVWTSRLRPAELEAWRTRIQRARAAPHRLSGPSVDWSARANRRRGWIAPAAALRNPHARASDAGAGASDPGSAEPAGGALATPPDTVRIAFIRIDFLADREVDRSSGDGRFDLTPTDTIQPAIDRPPHNRDFYLAHLEALRRYYDAESYGRVVVEGEVWPRQQDLAYSVSDMADFGPWKFSPDIYRAAVHMFRTMMFAADSQSIHVFQERIPWDDYDRFMVIHAGSDFQSDIRQDSPLDIPSFTLGVDDTDVVIFPDSLLRPIDRAAIVPETASQDGFYAAINGVVAHENGHNLFGFADLYNIETGFPVVGLWSLMDSGNLVGSQVELPRGDVIFAIGLLPPSLDPFHRFFCGDALAFRDVTWNDTLAVRDSERHPDMRRVWQSSDEYLVIENRWVAPGDTLAFDQDSTTRVILGPKIPDRYEYDALLPGGGMLVWHIDASVIPFETAFRPDYGFNTIPRRPGVSVVEADGLADLGDPGSPFLLGSHRDPWYRGNNTVLSDSTRPNLRPHIGTWPHTRLTFPDSLDSTMRLYATRSWQLAGWPVVADFPPGGPLLLAVDADGDTALEVCWAGGGDGPDSTALFAVRGNGKGLFGDAYAFATLDARPHPLMAAVATRTSPPIPEGRPFGPALFGISTGWETDSTGSFFRGGGKVWLLDHFGQPVPGWPAALPAGVTTPPVIAGTYPDAHLYVGCEDGRVYALGMSGAIEFSYGPLAGPVAGRLAVLGNGASSATIAAGSVQGEVRVLVAGIAPNSRWPQSLGGTGFSPDFLWLSFDGRQPIELDPAPPCLGSALVVHHADRLWAFCPSGEPLPGGWGRAIGDTMVAGLGAGDPDGDGFAEVLTQSTTAAIAFWNVTGYPSPGWPRRATRESFRTASPPLAVDVNANGRGDVVAMNASGILAALEGDGRVPSGWPLATGAGGVGAAVAADLDGDGSIEIVAPDRDLPDSLKGDVNGRFGTLYAYSLPSSGSNRVATSWTMVGGDPGRTSALTGQRTPVAAAPSPGPLVSGSLKAFPNPARRSAVRFAYQLTEPAEVEFRILDASGHEVTSFIRSGRQADNLEIWDPGDAPAGLYLAQVRFRSASGERRELVPLGLIR
jgi:M6 family metalloprotease-like protein